ncbi:Lrp/AsnC family transcriptional regulator [Paracoccus sp. YLB-12]|jgi:Lrp/AsnC family leucine-responsive transcriptional regulator|uniref:Lrp/AsnC family transcriptional regulator n=1 Tax=Paracoccus maritimus TaxID=2933292 RepID=A0ABT2K4Y2_9RHOB|nr:Lrp/AsnC family transcriptional regulator [Paracoccus sp. YLB-12]MCT4331597.1 Lrp/AsnC family transcriptional regulator [Paracoccus sp. YLB-12]
MNASGKNMPELDDTDRRILRLLQQDSTLSTQALAEKAGLSASPAWRRVRRMIESGMIRRQVALIDPAQAGLHAMAYVQVSLLDHTEQSLARFDRFVQTEDQIIECATITGTSDYHMKIIAPDPEGLEDFIMRRLLALGIVRGTVTNFVLRQTKYTTAMPL